MYRDSFDGKRFNPLVITRTKTVFNLPLKLKEPSRIFTCSLTDFFHEGIDSFREEAWEIIRKCPQHTFQILTKRPERVKQCLPSDWGDGYANVWLGTSVGSQASIERMVILSTLPARVKFLSLEPLHDEVKLDKALIYFEHIKTDFYVLPAYDWVIVGGESGFETGKYRYRPCKLEWIETIVDCCKRNHIPVFVKQMGTYLAKRLDMKDKHGGNIDEFPEHLKIREFPKVK
jgi:protein gp37